MSAHFKINVDCKTTISFLQEVQSKVSPKQLAAPSSTQLNICYTYGDWTWTIYFTYVCWCLIPFHEAASSCGKTLNSG